MKPRDADKTHRLFVALHPPTNTAREWLGLLATRDLPAHRVTPPEHVHMTVQFIGEVREADVDDVRESVARAAAGLASFTLEFTGLTVLPERGPARLIAARTTLPPTLAELQRRLAHRLARNPRARAGDRFLPHLTLARFSGSVALTPETREEMERGGGGPPFAAGFVVGHVSLMRSVLTSSGAIHSEVWRATLSE